MRSIILLTLNTLKITFRKKSNIIVFILLPVLSVLLSISLYSTTGSSTIKIGICDNNKSVLSKDFISSLKKGNKFKISSVEEKDIKSKVTDRSVDCVLVIPENFEKEIYDNSFNKLEIVSVKGEEATAWIQNYTNFYVRNLLDIAKASKGNRDSFNKMYAGYKEQALKLKVLSVKDETHETGATIQGIGFLIMFILLGAASTANFILKEKRQRTYFRIFTAPVNSKIYIGSNILANIIIILIQSVVMVFAATRIFNLNTHIPNLQLIAVLMCFGFVAIGLGILLVAFSDSSAAAGSMATLIITPTCMLSGCFWPVDVMPSYLQKLSKFFPQTWALEAIRKLQAGESFMDVKIDIAIVLAFALALFLIGIYKMKINDDVKNFV